MLGVTKLQLTHTFRHSFATHLLERARNPYDSGCCWAIQDCGAPHDLHHVLNEAPLGVSKPRRFYVAD